MVNDVVTNPVVSAINNATTDARVRLAMLMGAKLESGWNANAVGDNGHSFGAFQINIPAHPNVSSQNAQDPTWAAKFMLPSYQAGVNRVDPALWNADPALAAATAAFYAERPKVMYPTDRVRSSWGAVNSVWSGGSVPAGASGDTPAVDSLSAGGPISELADWTYWKVYDGFGGLADKIYFGMLIGGGALTMVVGLYLLLRGSRAVNIVNQTTSAYGSVLGGILRPIRKGTSDDE